MRRTALSIILFALLAIFTMPASAQTVLTQGTFFIDNNSNGLPDTGEGTLFGQRMWIICDFGFDGLPYTADDFVNDEMGVSQEGSFFATSGLNQCYITLPSIIFSTPPQSTIQPSGYEPTIMAEGGNQLHQIASFQYNNLVNEQQETSWVTDVFTVTRGSVTTVNIGVRLIGSGPVVEQPYKLYAPLVER